MNPTQNESKQFPKLVKNRKCWEFCNLRIDINYRLYKAKIIQNKPKQFPRRSPKF